MKSITNQKPIEEIEKLLSEDKNVFLIGCGTCPTLCMTGGRTEVMEASEALIKKGINVTGWTVIPVACDLLTNDALQDFSKEIKQAEAVIVYSCAFGVQNVSNYLEKTVIPGLNTMFVGIERGPSLFFEVCRQCGDCIIGETAGICPITNCAKRLLNGPCGGSRNGKCEISKDIDCAWQLIIDRLKAIGRLNLMDEVKQPKDWSTGRDGGPRKIELEKDWRL